MQLTPAHIAIREDFGRLINMTPEEMRAHFATPESDFASIDPRLAAKARRVSGRTLGKEALALKEKAEWEEGDYEKAAECTRTIKKFLGRKAVMQTEEGALTRYAVALRNRGHDPLKVQEAESLRQYGERIHAAFRAWVDATLLPPRDDDGPFIERPWLSDDRIFTDTQTLIFEWMGEYHRLGYLIGADGTVTITGTGEVVEPVWTPVPIDGMDATGTMSDIAEAEGEDGPKWHGTMIAAGPAKNRATNGLPRIYTDAALAAAVAEGTFDGIPGYQRTDAEHGKEQGETVVGSWGKAVWDPVARVVRNTFTWLKDKYPSLIHAQVKTAIAEGRTAAVPGFSITGTVTVDPVRPNVITKINAIRSCDPISFPSAGGTVQAVSESTLKEQTPMKTTVSEALAKKEISVPAALKAEYDRTQIDVAEGAAADFMVAQLKEKKAKLFEKMPDLEAKLAKDEGMLVALFEDFMAGAGVEPVKSDGEGDMPATEAVKKTVSEAAPVSPALLSQLNAQALEGVLAESKLDEVQKKHLRTRFAGQDFDPVRIQEAVKEAKDMQDAYAGASAGVQIVRTQEAKLEQMVNDFFCQDIRDRAARQRVAEAYGSKDAISPNIAGSNFSLRELVRALFPGVDPMRDLSSQTSVAEAMDTALAAKLLTNGINARIVFEYQNAGAYDGFRRFVNFVNHTDYQTKTAMAFGGFSGFADVAKGDPYPTLTESGLAAESYTIVKKGGIISVAEEDIRNDNVNAIASLPRRLAAEARRRMSAFAFGLITANPTLTTDSTALFAAGHANLLADALSSTSLREAIGLLQAQTHPNSTDKLMTRPAFLIVSYDPTQREAAYKLITPAADQQNGVAAFTQSFGLEILANPHTSDLDDWYLLGDPAEVPLIEIGLLDGREVPEVTVAQTDGVGTWFTHGTAQWRVKQAYSGTVVSHKGAVASIVP